MWRRHGHTEGLSKVHHFLVYTNNWGRSSLAVVWQWLEFGPPAKDGRSKWRLWKSVGSQSRGQRNGCPWPGISEACYSPKDWSTKASRFDVSPVGASCSCVLACDANAPQATLPINAAQLQPLASPAKTWRWSLPPITCCVSRAGRRESGLSEGLDPVARRGLVGVILQQRSGFVSQRKLFRVIPTFDSIVDHDPLGKWATQKDFGGPFVGAAKAVMSKVGEYADWRTNPPEGIRAWHCRVRSTLAGVGSF